MKKLILASGSPRRQQLLRQIGVEPEVFPVDAEEIKIGNPADVVQINAIKKQKLRQNFAPKKLFWRQILLLHLKTKFSASLGMKQRLLPC